MHYMCYMYMFLQGMYCGRRGGRCKASCKREACVTPKKKKQKTFSVAQGEFASKRDGAGGVEGDVCDTEVVQDQGPHVGLTPFQTF